MDEGNPPSNNAMEGWHSGFNQKLHCSHPTVWKLIPTIISMCHWRSSSLHTSYFIHAYLINSLYFIPLLFTSPSHAVLPGWRKKMCCQNRAKKKKTALSWCGAELMIEFLALSPLALSWRRRSVVTASSWGGAQMKRRSVEAALSWAALTW